MMRGRNKVNFGDKIYAVLTIDGETVVKFSDKCCIQGSGTFCGRGEVAYSQSE